MDLSILSNESLKILLIQTKILDTMEARELLLEAKSRVVSEENYLNLFSKLETSGYNITSNGEFVSNEAIVMLLSIMDADEMLLFNQLSERILLGRISSIANSVINDNANVGGIEQLANKLNEMDTFRLTDEELFMCMEFLRVNINNRCKIDGYPIRKKSIDGNYRVLPCAIARMKDEAFGYLCHLYEDFAPKEQIRLLETGCKWHFKTTYFVLPYELTLYCLKYRPEHMEMGYGTMLVETATSINMSLAVLEHYISDAKNWYYDNTELGDYGWNCLEHSIRLYAKCSCFDYFINYVTDIISEMTSFIENHKNSDLVDLLSMETGISKYRDFKVMTLNYIYGTRNINTAGTFPESNNRATGFSDVLHGLLPLLRRHIDIYKRTPLEVLDKNKSVPGWEKIESILPQIERFLMMLSRIPTKMFCNWQISYNKDVEALACIFLLKDKYGNLTNEEIQFLFDTGSRFCYDSVGIRNFDRALTLMDFSVDEQLAAFLNNMFTHYLQYAKEHIFSIWNEALQEKIILKIRDERDDFAQFHTLMDGNNIEIIKTYAAILKCK